MTTGFNLDQYVKMQTENIIKRIEQFNNKLYLEFGGKLYDDYHASRVLPGFKPDSKMRILEQLKDKTEIIFCISSLAIDENKLRSDIGISYETDILRQMDYFTKLGIPIAGVVITRYASQPSVDKFMNKMKRNNIKIYKHYPIAGYPNDVELIVSDTGYGKNEYVTTTRPLVVVTGPGPGSGKLATCLSQLYHEHENHINAGYAKYETFPIWNVPLKHPVNLAYEAATADLEDINMIDPFHLEAYNESTVNYNRDIEAFPVVKAILSKVTDDITNYKSPTDMGVNMVGHCIENDAVVSDASCKEIIRRYYKSMCDYKLGRVDKSAVEKIEAIMNYLEISINDRKVVEFANKKAKQTDTPCVAIELPNKKIVTGKTTDIMTAGANALINAIKDFAKIDDEILLITPTVLEPIIKLNKMLNKNAKPNLDISEVLVALSVSASTNPLAEKAVSTLKKFKGLEVHASHFLSITDEKMFRELKVNFTNEAEYPTKELYYR